MVGCHCGIGLSEDVSSADPLHTRKRKTTRRRLEVPPRSVPPIVLPLTYYYFSRDVLAPHLGAAGFYGVIMSRYKKLVTGERRLEQFNSLLHHLIEGSS